MSWPFDTSAELVTPQHVARLQRERRGLSEEEDRSPPFLLATFQWAAYDRLLQRAGAEHVTAHHGGSGGIGDRTAGAVDGTPVAIARISIGAPAAAIVLELAIARGARQVLVVGSAGSLQQNLPIGSTVIVDGAEREDGTSHHYLPVGEVVRADPELTARFEGALIARGATPVRGRSWTIDAPYRETTGAIARHRAAGVLVAEMEAAAIFAVAKVRGARAALAVAVSDELFDEWHPGFDHEDYMRALVRAADAAADLVPQLALDA